MQSNTLMNIEQKDSLEDVALWKHFLANEPVERKSIKKVSWQASDLDTVLGDLEITKRINLPLLLCIYALEMQVANQTKDGISNNDSEHKSPDK